MSEGLSDLYGAPGKFSQRVVLGDALRAVADFGGYGVVYESGAQVVPASDDVAMKSVDGLLKKHGIETKEAVAFACSLMAFVIEVDKDIDHDPEDYGGKGFSKLMNAYENGGLRFADEGDEDEG